MYDIVFSIPVHEKLEVIIDQILNINHYNPNSAIVIHINKQFNFRESKISFNKFLQIINSKDNIFINPNRLQTYKYGIIQTHISNYEFIKDKVKFNYICFCASNELFIKKGLYSYIQMYDCGVDLSLHNKYTNMKTAKMAFNDEQLLKYMKEVDNNDNDTKVISSQIEGSFYKKCVFDSIYYEIVNNFDFDKFEELYAREEIYLPTILYNLSKKNNINISKKGFITYIPWKKQFTLRVTINEIKKIINSNNNYFSVKRVDRELNNYLRKYIRLELSNGEYYHHNIGYNNESYKFNYVYSQLKVQIKDFIYVLSRGINKIRRYKNCK